MCAIVVASLGIRFLWPPIRLELQLQHDYPEFLRPAPAGLLDGKIRQAVEDGELERLWKLIWIRRDFHRQEYISETERQQLIAEVRNMPIHSLEERYYQVNILKYKLGINRAAEIGMPCDTLFLDTADFSRLEDANAYFDIKHFCDLDITEQDGSRLLAALRESNDSILRQHLLEHGTEEFMVEVGNCTATAPEDRYHCLFFS